ncbi:abortive infection family protein [Enterovibrio norvegicus]|uniref:Abortive infection C-terminus n=1 Tax=Enterovibrio norvegicus DSM 15893 TaxID=1121869 RepID=A0A1I5XQK0_9GAMM|nr:abortive infection family protein [Enterovibrio norvegicus]SFQ34106.1 Abortive infection C-terminus [Enterovibrio norvegicus DSM 15893]
MSNDTFRLRLSTRAVAETDTATHLIEQKERLESAIQEGDSSLSIDLSKAFLESVFKTIISDREETPNLGKDFYPLFNDVKQHVPFSKNDDISQKVSRLAGSIVNVTNELRNRYGAASHGDDGYHENPLRMAEVEFVLSSVDGLAAFLYKKHRETLEPDTHHRIQYDDYPDFNDWLDGQFDGFSLKLSEKINIEYTASQMLFSQDPSGYREMLIQFTSTEEEDDDE